MDIGHKLKVCLLSAATVVLGLAFSADGAVVDDATRMGPGGVNDGLQSQSIGRVRELLAKVEGREECKRMDFFDLAQPIAVTGDTAVALKLKCEVGGDCVMYWRSEGMPSFVSDRGVRFSAVGDGQFHSYVLRPDWKVSDKIVQLRIDFPYDRKNPDRKVSNSLKAVVFLRNGFEPFDSKDADGIVFRMKSDVFEYLSMNWRARKGDKEPKPFNMGFTTIPDGREHTFWFDLKNTKERMTFGAPHWFGTIEGFCFRANLRAAEFTPKGVEFVKGVPSIPADPVVRQVFPEDAIPRTGRPLPIEIVVRNYGTEPAEGIRFAVEGLPEGVRVLDPSDLSPKGSVAPSAGYDYIRDDYMPNGLPNERRFRITLSDPGRPVDFTAKLVLSANGGARSEKSFRVKVLPSLGLAKCAYPPEPRPLDTGDVEIGVWRLASFSFPAGCATSGIRRGMRSRSASPSSAGTTIGCPKCATGRSSGLWRTESRMRSSTGTGIRARARGQATGSRESQRRATAST